MTGILDRAARLLTSALVVAVVLAFAAFGWFGYRAVNGWRYSATLLASQRAAEAADRLVTALGRDMRGVQSTVLNSAQWDQFMLDPPYDVRTLAASAFARYPYPESFFAWRGPATPAAVVFLNRSDRRPGWMPGAAAANRFPVIVEYDAIVADRLQQRIERDALNRRRFSIFETMFGGTRYQIVARLLYRDAQRQELEGAFGFTVNLDWVRRSYFPGVTGEVARIGGSSSDMAFAVFDERGEQVAGTSAGVLPEPTMRRVFPLFFFDPALVALETPVDLPRRQWVGVAAGGTDPKLAEALRGSRETLVIAGIAAATLALGLALTVRAARASARLAQLRSEFVQTVTHELKTPIASIRTAGDTIARGRVTGPEALTRYANLVVQESKRLARLVDNLLAYARVTDVTEVYSFEPVDVHTVVDDVLDGFRAPLAAAGFELHVDIAGDLPPIRADRTACALVLNNLVDNAIRYSKGAQWLSVSARAVGGTVVIDVSDHGAGIPRDEITQVTRRFFRGKGAGTGGSGLGLAIADRIAK
ncbi:MAG: HAMP domain-containing sensor histidine kinase, partial [Acidobacteria bacterium]|nr:HAMP domain-containing sensor histidine kinase [Acidobacteriota bacterium]